jgi:hypothetical protein
MIIAELDTPLSPGAGANTREDTDIEGEIRIALEDAQSIHRRAEVEG